MVFKYVSDANWQFEFNWWLRRTGKVAGSGILQYVSTRVSMVSSGSPHRDEQRQITPNSTYSFKFSTTPAYEYILQLPKRELSVRKKSKKPLLKTADQRDM